MASKRCPIQIISGANWGSEAKGHVAGHLALETPVDIAVRTGAINAGHTVYYKGKAYAMQQIPVGFVNPEADLVIGPGAYIQPEILYREIEELERDGIEVRGRLYIDHRCGLHLPEYAQESAEVNRHHLIGATGKGCAEAIIHKIKDRNRGYELFVESEHYRGDIHIGDMSTMLAWAYDAGLQIQLEGTQGERLDFHLGDYPYVTSRQTTAATWVAEAGLSPAYDYDVILVSRTYPIRVAGNSGPMDGEEITWFTLASAINGKLAGHGRKPMVQEWALSELLDKVTTAARRIGLPLSINPLVPQEKWSASDRANYQDVLSEMYKVAINHLSAEALDEITKLIEMTTVTKKVRRIARLNRRELARTVQYTGAKYVALTFLNYEFPHLAGCTDSEEIELYAGAFIKDLQEDIGAKIRWVSTERYHQHLVEVNV